MTVVERSHLAGEAQQGSEGAQPESHALDGLRGLSALAVMIGHASVLPFAASHPDLVKGLGLTGRLAVIVFFVLSGHVIAKSILAMRRRGGFRLPTYAVNRFARVYPPYLLCLALAWLVVWLRGQGLIDPQPRLMSEPIAATATNALRDIVFLYGAGTPVQNANAPVWSLRIEVVCYIVAGLAAAAMQAGRGMALALVLVAVALLAAAVLRLESAVVGFAAFGLGAATAILALRPARWLVVATIGVLIVTGFVLYAAGGLLTPRPTLRYVYDAAAVLAAAAIVTMLATGRDGAVRGVLSGAAPIAPFSYTLFITHLPLMIMLGGMLPLEGSLGGKIASFAALVALPLAFAILAARLVERHVELRRWLVARLRLGS
jgi:peptidoglycan/LPS O-acetylase OafA/YrhL